MDTEPYGISYETNRDRLMNLQSKEFDAGMKFSESLRRLNMTPVVDDDYPQMRFEYERALTNLLAAFKENNRFFPGSRYGLIVDE